MTKDKKVVQYLLCEVDDEGELTFTSDMDIKYLYSILIHLVDSIANVAEVEYNDILEDIKEIKGVK